MVTDAHRCIGQVMVFWKEAIALCYCLQENIGSESRCRSDDPPLPRSILSWAVHTRSVASVADKRETSRNYQNLPEKVKILQNSEGNRNGVKEETFRVLKVQQTQPASGETCPKFW